jgi:acyl-CoA thioesterase-1
MDKVRFFWQQLINIRLFRLSGLLLGFILLSWPGINHSETLKNAETGQASRQTVLIMGDSLSAAFGIDKQKGWVALLQQAFSEDIQVVNASISGETTSGGRYRIGKALSQHQPDLVVIELGGNDGLRGTPIPQIKANLEAMIQDSQAAKADVILLGMRIPPNYGERYTSQFAEIYPALAKQYNTGFVPFFLEGVAGVEGMMQPDGIHPTEQAQSIMTAWVEEAIEKWLLIRKK